MCLIQSNGRPRPVYFHDDLMRMDAYVIEKVFPGVSIYDLVGPEICHSRHIRKCLIKTISN